MFAIITKKIEAELQAIADDLKEELRRDGHYATGETEKSIKVVAENKSISIKSNYAPKALTEGSSPVSAGSGGVDIVTGKQIGRASCRERVLRLV